MERTTLEQILITALVGPEMACWADDADRTGNKSNPMNHPEKPANNEVKADRKEIRDVPA